MEEIYIRMLGEFSLRSGENCISDSGSRSRKVWLLLAYLICHRGRVIPARELISVLWGEEPSGSNPENTLKITFHRARTLLDRLWPGAGHQLILYQDVGYTWNREIPIRVDAEELELLCRTPEEPEEAYLEACLAAVELYQGDCLQKLSSEIWVIPLTTHYHNLYVRTVRNAVPLLAARSCHGRAAQILRRAISVEPYHEPLHQLLIQELAAMGDAKGAAAVYEELRQRLFQDFGIKPSEQTRAVYREAVRDLGGQQLSIETVMEQMQEKDPIAGALQCDYDYFKVLCHVEARAMQRSGRSTHIALISVGSPENAPLSQRSMEKAMEHMGEQIRLNLRRGDTFSRCSLSQYAIMLPQANYEDSCMVCRRLLGAFARKHPNSPARIHFVVQPLSPCVCVP